MFQLSASAIRKALSLIHTFIIRARSSRVRIGRKSIVYYKSKIFNYSNNGIISIGRNSQIGCTSKGCHAGMPYYTTILNDGTNSTINIGNDCRINGAYIHAKQHVGIGDKCVIATGVNIIDSNGHIVNSEDRTKGIDNPQEVLIGNNVWIGLSVTILKGTRIGNNCVVAAGSVVKGAFPDNVVISGNPACVIRSIQLE